MPFKNPLTKHLYTHKKDNVVSHFPFLVDKNHILSFESYYKDTPQKYYDKVAFNDFLYFLNIVKLKKSNRLKQLLTEREDRLSLAISNLESVNDKEIHNMVLPKDFNLSRFINENINFELLKLWESPFNEFLYLLAAISREARGKSTDGMDVYNVVEELNFLPDEFLSFKKYRDLYNSIIRNGIGHGKVEFLEGRTKYTEKKNSVDKSNDFVITLFDDLVDTLNGFCFALKTFYFINEEYINSQKINIPNAIMLKELIVGASAPKWNVKSCLESTVQGKRQINIFIETEFYDLTTLHMNIFHTGILAGELTNKYDIVSLQMQNGLSGLAMFDAAKIRQINETTQNPQLEDYARKAYLKDSELVFFMKPNSWKIFRKIDIMKYIVQILLPIYFSHFYKKTKRKFEVMQSHIYSKKWFNVVEGKIILDLSKINDAETYIKQNYKTIINEVIKTAKSDKSFFSKLWLLPTKFATVQVYLDNVRVREWRNSKTKDIKSCTLSVNNTKSIKIPIIFPKNTEVINNYTILWNSFLNELDKE